jgi:hypothetical protein
VRRWRASRDNTHDRWEDERKADVLAKVVGDFREWDKDAAKYAASFKRLLAGLQGTGAGAT